MIDDSTPSASAPDDGSASSPAPDVLTPVTQASHVDDTSLTAPPPDDTTQSPGRAATRKSGRQAQLDSSQLRPGWTTGACAAAASRAAWVALHTGEFPDPVEVWLPSDRLVDFALTQHTLGDGWAEVAITKDAGDDPDVTHGAIIRARVARRSNIPRPEASTTDLALDATIPSVPPQSIVFRGGPGVGMVTRPGLPLDVGEPAINPVPRSYIEKNLELTGFGTAAVVEISVDHGAEIAKQTWNPRIGIVGGISILGTTGVVVPYSCSAWIASIREGIDVARASGVAHVAGCTGSTSERVVTELYPGIELIDMGDFVGAVLKYLAQHPIGRLTICGGFAKISKLANGHLDLHSHRTSIDVDHLATLAHQSGASDDLAHAIRGCNTAKQALDLCQQQHVDLGAIVAAKARAEALAILGECGVDVEVICTDAKGGIVGRANPDTSRRS